MARRNGRTADLPAVTYTFSFQAQYPNKPGMLARIATAVAECGGNIGDIDVIRSSPNTMLSEVTVRARDSAHAEESVDDVRAAKCISVGKVPDRRCISHRGSRMDN